MRFYVRLNTKLSVSLLPVTFSVLKRSLVSHFTTHKIRQINCHANGIFFWKKKAEKRERNPPFLCCAINRMHFFPVRAHDRMERSPNSHFKY